VVGGQDGQVGIPIRMEDRPNHPVPAYPCDFGTTDTCQNLTTGAMGSMTTWQYTPTGGCANYAHRFWAQADLAYGANLLLIMAKDSRGNVGRAYDTVTRTQDLTPP
jgi:hypothetical protein